MRVLIDECLPAALKVNLTALGMSAKRCGKQVLDPRKTVSS